MTVLHDVAVVAAAILIIELLVVIVVFLGVAGGLAFGLHWVRGKRAWAFEKVNGYLGIGTRYLHLGTDYAAKPFILTSGAADTTKGTVRAIQTRIRVLEAERKFRTSSVAARPVARPAATDVTSAQPLVDDEQETILLT